MTPSATQVQKIIGQVSALAMLDETFKARLMSEPLEVLEEHGLDLTVAAPGMDVKVLESDEEVPPDAADGSTLYLVVPDAEALSLEELSLVAGGIRSCFACASTAGCTPSCVGTFSSASTESCR
jgi:hypothetical protein